MEQKNQINEVLGLTMQKLKDMVDVNTVVGTPITTPDGVTVIPVSKISVGFASGGSDFAPKSLPANKANCFGGGTGAGISVVPVSFLIIHGDTDTIVPYSVSEQAAEIYDTAQYYLIPGQGHGFDAAGTAKAIEYLEDFLSDLIPDQA